MNDKNTVLSTGRKEFERWEALLSSLSEQQITAPQLPEGWSIKDVIAHLRAWQQRSIARLEAALRGGKPEFPAWPAQLDPEAEGQPHELNAWLYAASRDLPWSKVHQDWRDGFLHLLYVGEQIEEEDLLDPGKYAWLDGYSLADILQASCEHHAEHAENLAPLLAQLRQPGNAPAA